MLNLRGIRAPLLAGLISAGVVGCEHDLTLSPPVNPGDAVVAQFDPTNPIPVLQLVPTPTALAEEPGTGRLKVAVYDCEKPSTKQCLAFVDNFPPTTPVTLFFSAAIDEASLAEGVTIVKEGSGTAIPFTATVGDRPQPNAACAEGGNGSGNPADPSDDRTYDPAKDVAPGIQAILRPNTPLDPGATYYVYVESYVDDAGVVHGVKTADGKKIEPSNLFALLNAPKDHPPITNGAEGPQLVSPLLRSNVSSLVLAALFPSKTLADLTPDELATFKTVIGQRSVTLFGLYSFFESVIEKGEEMSVFEKRNQLVFANKWHTGLSGVVQGGEVLFDPLRGKVPFPNAELLTTVTSTRVTIPINPCGATPTPGCDSATAQGLKGGLNTLDGFSTTAPISIPFSSSIDAATLAGNVVMYKVDDTGMVVEPAVEIDLGTRTSSGTDDAVLLITPKKPLAETSRYVIALKKGIKGTDGFDFRRPQTFNFLTVRDPLLVDGAINPDALVTFYGSMTPAPVQTFLQCSTVAATGMLASDAVVNGTAAQIENQLRRARFAQALDELATASTAFPEGEILLAFSYKTQTITGVTDLITRQLLGTAYQNVLNASMTPAIFGPVRTATTPQAVQGTILVTLCLSGQIPGVATNTCLVNGSVNPALFANPLVQQLLPLYAGGIDSMRLYLMANYIVTRGNPLSNGGTFTPASVMQPRIIQTPVWVITPAIPAAGKVPVVIFQHGLGQVKETGFFIASTFARTGYATVLMDLPYHGSRANDLVNNMTGAPCPAIQPEAVTCAAQGGVCMGGCDGTQDSSGSGFLSSNVFAARDNFRQGIIDQFTLIKLIQSQSMAGGALTFLDGASIGYAGQSLGGITGGNLAAYAPELKAAVLNVPGGGLVNILLSTVPQISAPLFAALSAAGVCARTPTGCEDNAAFRQFGIIAQTALDPGDPLANSIAVLGPHHGVPPITPAKVLIQMAVPDLVVTNPTTIALGKAYGFDPTDNSATSHFQTYNFASGGNCHGFILFPGTCTSTELGNGPFSGFCATFGAQQQAARFIATGGTMVGPRNPMGFGALGCN